MGRWNLLPERAVDLATDPEFAAHDSLEKKTLACYRVWLEENEEALNAKGLKKVSKLGRVVLRKMEKALPAQ